MGLRPGLALCSLAFMLMLPCGSPVPSTEPGRGWHHCLLHTSWCFSPCTLHFNFLLAHHPLTATSPGALCKHDGDRVPFPGSVLFHEVLMGWHGPLLTGVCVFLLPKHCLWLFPRQNLMSLWPQTNFLPWLGGAILLGWPKSLFGFVHKIALLVLSCF